MTPVHIATSQPLSLARLATRIILAWIVYVYGPIPVRWEWQGKIELKLASHRTTPFTIDGCIPDGDGHLYYVPGHRGSRLWDSILLNRPLGTVRSQ